MVKGGLVMKVLVMEVVMMMGIYIRGDAEIVVGGGGIGDRGEGSGEDRYNKDFRF